MPCLHRALPFGQRHHAATALFALWITEAKQSPHVLRIYTMTALRPFALRYFPKDQDDHR
jgi:hypothetical protein